MIRREEALAYHEGDRPGKIEVRPIKRCLTARDMRLAALPGAGFPCAAIADDPEAVFRYTAKGNLVGIITNGSAVPGLGDVGPVVAKPMLEGAAVLFKRLADLDGFDLELDTRDPDRFVETVQHARADLRRHQPEGHPRARGPRHLRAAARGRCTSRSSTRTCQSPAVVAAAALLNALDLADKASPTCASSSAAPARSASGCARDVPADGRVAGASLRLRRARAAASGPGGPQRAPAARSRSAGAPATLDEGLRGADVFVGASAPGVLTQAMIRSMARYPVVFALATPEPEIGYEEARASRRDVIVATALTQFPNAIVDHLSYPYHLPRRARRARRAHHRRHAGGRGAGAGRPGARGRRRRGEPRLRLRAVQLRARVPAAEADRPAHPGRASRRRWRGRPWRTAWRGSRSTRRPTRRASRSASGPGRETLRRLMVKARQVPLRIVFADGASDTIQRAAAILAEEGIAQPVLLGDEGRSARASRGSALDPSGLTIVDPVAQPAARRVRRRVPALRPPARRDAADGRAAAAAHRVLRRDDAAQRRRRHARVGHRAALRRLAARDARDHRHRRRACAGSRATTSCCCRARSTCWPTAR